MKPKCIVLLSGGMDSAVALYWARKTFKTGIGLGIYYGQRHMKELDSSRALCKEVGWTFIEKELLLDPICESALTTDSLSLNYKKRGLPASFVPGRNLFFLTVAGVIAYNERFHHIVGGWNAVDFGGYPDCRENFLSVTTQALNEAFGLTKKDWITGQMHIHRPLVHKTKQEIVEMGLELDVPFGLTWSCYEGGEKPCGKCNACKVRAKGFKQAGVVDPLLEV